ATRAPALRPPEITGRPGAVSAGQTPRQPVSRVLGAGATFLPATRQGCSTRATVTPCAGSVPASATRSLASMPPPAPWLTARTRRGPDRAACQVTRAGPASVSMVSVVTSEAVVTSEECALLGGRQLLQELRPVVADVADRRAHRAGAPQPGGRRGEQLAQLARVGAGRVEPGVPAVRGEHQRHPRVDVGERPRPLGRADRERGPLRLGGDHGAGHPPGPRVVVRQG